MLRWRREEFFKKKERICSAKRFVLFATYTSVSFLLLNTLYHNFWTLHPSTKFIAKINCLFELNSIRYKKNVITLTKSLKSIYCFETSKNSSNSIIRIFHEFLFTFKFPKKYLVFLLFEQIEMCVWGHQSSYFPTNCR